jgi:hypothetical protein
MKLSIIGLIALAIVVTSVTSCSKASDVLPSYGSVTVDGATMKFLYAQPETLSGAYSLSGFTSIDTSNITTLVVTTASKPTTSGDILLGGITRVSFLSNVNHVKTVRTYGLSTEKITATVTGGKVKFAFTNLTQTDVLGGGVAGGKPLTGSISE